MSKTACRPTIYCGRCSVCPEHYTLIAAAPDLLAALEMAGHTSMCSDDSELTPTAKEGRFLCERCAAIAAAKGETK